MEKARLLFLIFIYSMLAMACSTEPEIPSGVIQTTKFQTKTETEAVTKSKTKKIQTTITRITLKKV